MSPGRMSAAGEIGRMVSRILELAPKAGLHVGIKITPALAAAAEGRDVKQARVRKDRQSGGEAVTPGGNP